MTTRADGGANIVTKILAINDPAIGEGDRVHTCEEAVLPFWGIVIVVFMSRHELYAVVEAVDSPWAGVMQIYPLKLLVREQLKIPKNLGGLPQP